MRRVRFFLPAFLFLVLSFLLLSGVLGRFAVQLGGHTQSELLPELRPVLASPAPAHEEKKENAPKVELSYLVNTWGLECKSQKVERYYGGGGGRQITLRLAFTRDVPNRKELREQFTAREPESSDSALWFYFFDSENVMIYKTPPNKIEGEVTGVKGDAIRVIIFAIREDVLGKTQKIEVRPGEKEKKR